MWWGESEVGTGVKIAARPVELQVGTVVPVLDEQQFKVVQGTSSAVKFAKIEADTTGNTQVVAAVTGKKIRVHGALVIANAAVTVKFQSATTDITGPMSLSANGGFAHESILGMFETAAGEALNINLSANQSVGGHLSYVEV